MLITKNHKLAEVILHDHRLIPVVTRFEIRFGIGDKTVEEICSERDINAGFFLEIVNAFHDKDYIPNEKLQDYSLKLIIDFLLKSHKFYSEIKIPFIEKLIRKLSWQDKANDNNRKLLDNFFNEYKKEFNKHTKNEETEIYPYVIDIENAFLNNNFTKEIFTKIKNNPINKYAEEHSGLDDALLDLKNIIIKYLPPPTDFTVTNKILEELFKLEKDLINHTRIENTVLIPEVLRIEKEILKQKKS